MEKEIENAQNDFQEYCFCYLCSLFLFLLSSDDMENLLAEISNLELPSYNRCCSHCNKEFYNQKVKCDDCGNLIISKIMKADNSNKSTPSLKAMPKYLRLVK